MELNKDIEARDKIIYGKYRPKKYGHGGTAHFEDMTAKTLGRLLRDKFADPEDAQNLAPTLQEFYDFLKTHKGYTVHGYTVSADRDDYRVSIEGLYKPVPASTPEEYQDFINFNKYADELQVQNYMYSWFD